ncbi:hypothetical protein BDV36DRAFT_279561 [Aspergillus pseudocaelatus]|uniref:Uncharacterized protein n=1 Tax=Aspergillus pseudocaelatus TaxID=1825620 RepID=A0ABQ6X177_9EURO|nr:hypothetical protein BDV36DRAFT_279561 [Aspergillus pseudocaelatus]
MHHFFLYSSLFTATLGYRLFEYTGERCTGSNLNEGVASSLLVKIDNVHDDLYQVNVYENEDCTGSILGAIANTNGCLNLHVFSAVGNPFKWFLLTLSITLTRGLMGKSRSPLCMVGSAQPESPTTQKMGPTSTKPSIFGFRMKLIEHSIIKDLWFHKFDEECPSNYLNNTSPHVHDARQLELAYCNLQAVCMGAVDLGGRFSNSAFARGLVNFVVGHTANGVTIIKRETKTTRQLAGDLVNSAGTDGVTNVVWVIKDENGKEWEPALRARPLGASNNNNCGACALYL